jgi:hypothetical protein
MHMKTYTAMLMFAVIATVAFASVTLVLPIAHEAEAGKPSGIPPCDGQDCKTNHPTGAPISPPGKP